MQFHVNGRKIDVENLIKNAGHIEQFKLWSERDSHFLLWAKICSEVVTEYSDLNCIHIDIIQTQFHAVDALDIKNSF